MTLLCDCCLDETPMERLVDCADFGRQHCPRCTEACEPCAAAAADDHAADIAADVALERCEQPWVATTRSR